MHNIYCADQFGTSKFSPPPRHSPHFSALRAFKPFYVRPGQVPFILAQCSSQMPFPKKKGFADFEFKKQTLRLQSWCARM